MNAASAVLADERTALAPILSEWDGAERNRERSHSRKRDYRSIEALDIPRKTPRGGHKPAINISLDSGESFEDILFSENPDDIHELVSDGTLANIIKSLTAQQKRVLHMVAVQRYSVPEAAEVLGVSARNVHKVYQTALYHIQGKLYPVVKLRHKLEFSKEYQEAARERGMATTRTERRFLETAKKDVIEYYGEMTGDKKAARD